MAACTPARVQLPSTGLDDASAYACCEAYPFVSALTDRLRGHAPG